MIVKFHHVVPVQVPVSSGGCEDEIKVLVRLAITGTPGAPPITYGPSDDWDPRYPAEFEIVGAEVLEDDNMVDGKWVSPRFEHRSIVDAAVDMVNDDPEVVWESYQQEGDIP